MEIRLSARVARVRPSHTLAVSAKAAQLRAEGRDIIGLGVGEPDFDTPEPIKQAAYQAIADGYTKYTQVDGLPVLKQAVADKLRRDNGLDYGLDQILVSCGGKHSLYNLCQAMLDSGDEVIIPAPYWVSYPDIVLLADATPVIVDCPMASGFKLQPEQLREAINANTRMVIINSPSNPTGVAYSRAELEALGEVLRDYPEVLVVSDDIYEHILWTPEPFVNILMACPDLVERGIVLNGVSKAYAMTGWRIGYAAGPKPLIAAMKKMQSQSTSNPAAPSQMAAVAALNGDQSCIEPMLEAFQRRHRLVVDGLNAITGISCLPSQGAFYAFPDVTALIAATDGVGDDVELAERLLEETDVAVVPGTAFGAPGHIRLSFATSDANLEEALARISRFAG
jgi:aspartate aminotransferase